jgi:hypothetical protein
MPRRIVISFSCNVPSSVHSWLTTLITSYDIAIKLSDVPFADARPRWASRCSCRDRHRMKNERSNEANRLALIGRSLPEERMTDTVFKKRFNVNFALVIGDTKSACSCARWSASTMAARQRVARVNRYSMNNLREIIDRQWQIIVRHRINNCNLTSTLVRKIRAKNHLLKH